MNTNKNVVTMFDTYRQWADRKPLTKAQCRLKISASRYAARLMRFEDVTEREGKLLRLRGVK